jgi:micrococcal nuclease
VITLQFLLGCLGIIIILGIIMAVLSWLFNNIVGVLGIAFAIWGIYEWNINRKLGAKSKVPGVIVAIGVIVASAWFIGSESITVPSTSTPASLKGSLTANKTDTSRPETQSVATNTAPAQSNTSNTGVNNSVQEATKTQSKAVTGSALISAKVLEVIDGDTIKVSINGKEETVRMLLVDTPETKHPQLGEQPFGKEASNFTKQLLSGKTVQLEQDVNNGPDKYGRLLYYVYLDGKSVQEQLLEKGLARVAYVYVPNVKYVDKYREIQAKAQQAGVGIWSIENYAQEDGFHSEVVKKNGPGPDQKTTGAKSPQPVKSQPAPAHTKTPEQIQQEVHQEYVFFNNCSEARAAGAAPIYRGEPGYRPKLDRDNDGVACE